MLTRARMLLATACVAVAKAVIPRAQELEEPELTGHAPAAVISDTGFAMLDVPRPRPPKQTVIEGPLPGSIASRRLAAKGRTA